MRLNLGSGPHATAGWICIDRSPNVWLDRVPLAKRLLLKAGLINEMHAAQWDREVERHDIRSLPYPDRSVEAVYSSHALEHVYLNEARTVLAESFRVLRSRGIIRLALPDCDAIARELVDASAAGDPDAGKRFNDRLLTFPPDRPGSYRQLRTAMGGHVHRWQPTRSQVRQMLEAVGFVEVTDRTFKEGALPGAADIETRAASFFLEAVKP